MCIRPMDTCTVHSYNGLFILVYRAVIYIEKVFIFILLIWGDSFAAGPLKNPVHYGFFNNS